jgi:flagellar protein FlaJ
MIREDLFYFVGEKISRLFPKMGRQLKTTRMDENPKEYLGNCVYKSLRAGVPAPLSLSLVGFILDESSFIIIGLMALPLVTSMSFLTFAKLPSIKTKRRTRKLEKNLPYALRDVLIQIQSGIPLYEAFKSATEGYGATSDEFESIIRDVDSGRSMSQAIEDSIVRNPSKQYRRAMWQLATSIKSGTEISDTLKSIVDSIIKDQELKIEKYGKSLNPYILVYLLVAVVGPSLGITGMVVVSSFTGLSIGIQIYTIVTGIVLLAQVFFLNLVKSSRPAVKT